MLYQSELERKCKEKEEKAFNDAKAKKIQSITVKEIFDGLKPQFDGRGLHLEIPLYPKQERQKQEFYVGRKHSRSRN